MKPDIKQKNIIFDLGGVILNIDYHLPEIAFKKLGIDNFTELFSKAKQTPLFDDFETGRISPDEFRDQLRSMFKKNIPDHEIDFAWNAILLDLPVERIKLLSTLKENHRLFLLSNTNRIHVAEFMKYFEKAFGENTFENLFEKIYFSNEIGLRKPEREIFELVLSENDIDPSDTLFIDDSIQHIESATQLGIGALHLDKGMSIENIFMGLSSSHK